MLEINTEVRKGIFFIRLRGVLTKDTVSILNKEITNLVKELEIRNIVFNIENIKEIDLKGINSLFYNYELSITNKGKILICGINDEEVTKKIKRSRLLNYIKQINNELHAFRLIEI